MRCMRRRARRSVAVAAVGAALVLCACDAPGTKAGADPAPVTLRLAAVESPANNPYAPEVEEFARLVSELSDDTIRVEVMWEQAGWVPDAETRAAQSVRAGAVDLALVPTRAFSDLGVDRLNALQAPFLIDSAELAGDVSQSDVVTRMLADLESEGFVGLAMAFETLRHPAAYDAPLLGADDYVGKGLRVPQSDVARRLFRLLDARPEVSHIYEIDLRGQELHGAEGAFAWWEPLPENSVMTGNVTFYPKYNALLASPDSWSHLTDEQRAVMLRAAREMSRNAMRGPGADIEDAAGYCLTGRTVAIASDSEVRTLIEAAEPLVRELEADPIIGSDIAAIRAMKAEASAAPFELPWQCMPRTGDWEPWPDLESER